MEEILTYAPEYLTKKKENSTGKKKNIPRGLVSSRSSAASTQPQAWERTQTHNTCNRQHKQHGVCRDAERHLGTNEATDELNVN